MGTTTANCCSEREHKWNGRNENKKMASKQARKKVTCINAPASAPVLREEIDTQCCARVSLCHSGCMSL